MGRRDRACPRRGRSVRSTRRPVGPRGPTPRPARSLRIPCPSAPMSRPLPKSLAAMAAAAMLAGVAGCGSTSDTTTSGNVAAADCTPDKMQTKTPGELTVATDKPAYPPYFEDNDPTNGKGFESATAYAIADQLGYASSDVNWVVEPFNSSYAPGPKD